MLLAAIANAQLPPGNEKGVAMGHLHFRVSDPAVHQKLLVDVLGAKVLHAGALENGTVSVTSAVERLTGNLGTQTRAAQMGRDTAALVNESDVAARDAVSGVNLDEEAANMLRFQQAYQAAAQIIAISGQLFDELISAVRR